VPLIAFFAARLLIGPLLYTRCVPCGLADRLGAAVAGMALSHRIARGVLQGLRGRRAVFEITRKAEAAADLGVPAADAGPVRAGHPGRVRVAQSVWCSASACWRSAAARTTRGGWAGSPSWRFSRCPTAPRSHAG
jgi:hypothetical protein